MINRPLAIKTAHRLQNLITALFVVLFYLLYFYYYNENKTLGSGGHRFDSWCVNKFKALLVRPFSEGSDGDNIAYIHKIAPLNK